MQSQISTTAPSAKKRQVVGSSTRERSKRRNNEPPSEPLNIKNSKSYTDKNSSENKPYTSPESTLKGNLSLFRYKRLKLQINSNFLKLSFRK